jgi:hypothetical protein
MLFVHINLAYHSLSIWILLCATVVGTGDTEWKKKAKDPKFIYTYIILLAYNDIYMCAYNTS